MKAEIVQAFLAKVLEEDDEFDATRKHIQTMAGYKYDNYQQYFAGKRFIESFALWLNQFDKADRKFAFEFVRDRLIFVSAEEFNSLVASCFPDFIKPRLLKKVSDLKCIAPYKTEELVSSIEYKTLLRQSLFCGLSDGARMDAFRRANSGTISHEQIYQTYELSEERARKMTEELGNDMKSKKGEAYQDSDGKFKMLFLLDDFSASGSSYLKVKSDGALAGKINALCSNLMTLNDLFDIDNLEINIILYLCTEQAYTKISEVLPEITKKYKITPNLYAIHKISDYTKISQTHDVEVYALCEKDQYYDKEIEDKHTGTVKLGYKDCALPVVLHHNTPNNSIPLLWAYDYLNFKGLFPRIPRHREI